MNRRRRTRTRRASRRLFALVILAIAAPSAPTPDERVFVDPFRPRSWWEKDDGTYRFGKAIDDKIDDMKEDRTC